MASLNWYVQLSRYACDNIIKNSARFPGLFEYELGNAKMTILPKVDDHIILLGKKHELSKGFIYEMYEPPVGSTRIVIFLDEINPVYTGRFYRRNWTVKEI